MTNEEIIASAKIFALCESILEQSKEADVSNAQRFPLRMLTQYVRQAHARRKVTRGIQKRLAALMDEISEATMRSEFGRCLSLEQQGVWILAYRREAANEQSSRSI